MHGQGLSTGDLQAVQILIPPASKLQLRDCAAGALSCNTLPHWHTEWGCRIIWVHMTALSLAICKGPRCVDSLGTWLPDEPIVNEGYGNQMELESKLG